jgi:hypothetical protein
MKKSIFFLILIFCISNLNPISLKAQFHRNYEKRPIFIQQEHHRVGIGILPILGAIVTTAIINNELNDYDSYDLNTREMMRLHYYQNQLELERLEYLERQQCIRERRFLGIFPRRHHRF